MAYTTEKLVEIYTNANLGKGPDLATQRVLEGYAAGTTNGNYTDPDALAKTLDLLDSTTSVAVMTRQFFAGAAPSVQGLIYAVNSADNANDLNDAGGTLAKFSQENRYINLAVSLGTGAGEGAASFAAKYGTGVSYAQAVTAAYDIIIGNNVAKAAGVDVAAATAYLSRADNIAFLTKYVSAPGMTDAQVQLAVKAALIGQILNVAATYNLGSYAQSTTALLNDLSDGTLNTDNAAGVNILTAYPASSAVGTTFTLIPGADTVVGTGANDTINALTVKADGAGSNTFTAFDTIDGGAGVDTLNIYTDSVGNYNMALPASATVKNVEIVNILNAGTAAALADASKYAGIQQLWQVNTAAGVTGLGTGVTAGFRNVAQDVSVTTNLTAVSAAIALDGFADSKGVAPGTQTKITVDGSGSDKLATVSLSGTVVDGVDANTSASKIALDVKLGDKIATANVNTAVAVDLTFAEVTAGKLTSVNLAGSTGAVTYTTAANTVASITGGGANDTLTIITQTVKADAATNTAAVSAVLDGGAGNDTIVVNTTGNGTTTITGGVGNDKVTLNGRGSGVLTVNLGDGNDSFIKGTGTVNATDVIDGGAGIDTLQLSAVGVANIGAFSNFEVFDVVALGKALDVDILATKNTVTEFVTTGGVGAGAALTNIGAGVGYRITADTTVAQGLSLTQKTAGALTITLDIDETGSTAATTAVTDRDASATATNASSINAVFDSAFVGASTGAGDNSTNLKITGTAATSLSVVSGGTNASNDLDYTAGDDGTDSVLTSVTVTGSSALNLDLASGGNAQASVNASAFTGALTFDTADLKAESAANTFNGGLLTLGSGDDVITVTQGASIAGIEKATGEDLTAQKDFDILLATGSIQASDVAATATVTVNNGLLTFNGAGPSTLAAALGLADTDAATSAGETVVFEYLGNSYVFVQGGAAGLGDDLVVKLVGTTGLAGIDTIATGQAYVF